MKLFLVRHASTLQWETDIILGQLHGTLSEKGMREAHQLGVTLSGKQLGITQIYTSTLQRAIDTGNIINEYLQVPLSSFALLNERGAWVVAWMHTDEIDWQAYEAEPLATRKHPWGESFLEVEARVREFVDGLASSQDRVLVVSHSVVILMMIKHFNHASLEDSLKFDIGNEVIEVETKMG